MVGDLFAAAGLRKLPAGRSDYDRVMTEWGGPTLFCFDGSDGSRAALGAAARRLRPGPAIVLTVWETVALRMASQAFAVAAPIDNEAELDGQEVTAARAAAEEGARLAREHGWDAEPRLAMARSTTWGAIVEVANELDASLVVCGTRGLSGVRGFVLGSVSHAVLHRMPCPVLAFH